MALEVVHGPSTNIEAAHELADLLDRELLAQLAEAFERGEVSPDQLPPKLLRQLSNHLNQLPGFDDNR